MVPSSRSSSSSSRSRKSRGSNSRRIHGEVRQPSIGALSWKGVSIQLWLLRNITPQLGISTKVQPKISRKVSYRKGSGVLLFRKVVKYSPEMVRVQISKWCVFSM